ncbi:hypothetical protein IV203_019055 [Nitzschia inconspicua]|uniref:SCP domain-containing protein n=1 Tax=Nitzschia inconspicua TaxID=303405 RepID=A0A9K3LZ45_9STRA|nr:hypothetical protein IV203_019055 [Nitzschia inconspicua]
MTMIHTFQIIHSTLLLSILVLFLSCSYTVAQRDQLGSSSGGGGLASLFRYDPGICKKDNEFLLEITVKTDNFPEDTSWMLVRSDTGRLVDMSFRFQQPNTESVKATCIQEGITYEFAIMDAHGDGLCCKHGAGFYKAVFNGDQLLFEGGDFDALVEHTFTVRSSGGQVPQPVSSPTLAPAPIDEASVSSSRPRIRHPHCDPSSNRYNPSSDNFSGCSGKLAQCTRDRSLHKWEYDEAATMIDKCFRSCANRVGLDNFCRVIPPPTPVGEPRMPFCNSEGQSNWNPAFGQKEIAFVQLLNQQRARGYNCPTEYFPPLPAVRRNPQLNCAARAQARKIVDYSINPGFRSNSPTLHQVCNPSKGNCDTFRERMEKAGYENWWGYIGENCNWGYSTAASTLKGWSESPGHCPLLHKQDFIHIQVEVGVGYYRDAVTGKEAWVMVAGQQ